MYCKEQLLKMPHNTKLSYVGAALLGVVLNVIFNFFTSGHILIGIVIYVAYVVFILFVDTLCNDGVKYACHFNEFWITLDELAQRKLGK